MKYTLLELTQYVMSSIGSDEVNSITDTVESRDILKIIKQVYEDIVSRANLPEHYELFQLTASGDVTKPTLMFIPDTVKTVLWIKYNKETLTDTDMLYSQVKPIDLESFLERMYGLRESTDNVVTFSHDVGLNSVDFLCTDNAHPTVYTTFDDYTVVFDSYDVTVDSTLQQSKTLAYGLLRPTWTESNSFTPDLDENQFPLLLNEIKSLAWAELKQLPHAKAEQSAKRAWAHLQHGAYRLSTLTELDKAPNYGRKR